MSRKPIRRFTCQALVVSLIAALATAPVAADPSARFGGRLVDAGGAMPASPATVHLVDDRGAEPTVAASAATTEDGQFTFNDATAGEFRLLVETPGGSFLAPGHVTLAPGDNRPLALTIDADRDHGFGNPEGAGLSTWGAWLIAGAIGIAALFVISEVTDDEDPASAF